jgi:hypothetical protein
MIIFNDKKYNDNESKNNILISIRQGTLKLVENKNHSIMFSNVDTVYGLMNTLSINKIYDDILEENIEYGPIKGTYNAADFENNQIQSETGSYICYESKTKICIVEAKMKPYEDFNIRQLYYPYRALYDVVGNDKEIFCLYIFKDRYNIIHIYKFEWKNYRNMLDVSNTGFYKYKII